MENKSLTFFKLFALLAGIILLIIGLFIPLVSDAGIYASAAKEILINKQWIKLTVAGDPYLHKPPFHFWLSAISYKIFGMSVVSYKLPTVLLSLLALFSTYKIGHLLYSKQVGYYAAAMFGFSQMYFLYNMDVHTDTVFMTAITFSIWHLIAFIQQQKWLNMILAAVAVAAAMLTKGPVGVAVPAFAVGAHLLLTRDFKNLFNWKWLVFVGFIILAITPYLAGLYKVFGWEGVQFYFWDNMADRVDGSSLSYKNKDYFFYLHTLLYLLLPWSLIIYPSIYKQIRHRAKEYFTLGAIVLFTLILSVSTGRAPHYIFPVIPLLFVLMARWLVETGQDKYRNVVFKIQPFILLILWALVPVIFLFVFKPVSLVLTLVTVLLFAATIYIQVKIRGTERFMLTSIFTVLAINFLMIGHIMPKANEYSCYIQASEVYNADTNENKKVIVYDYSYREPMFYFDGIPSRVKLEKLNVDVLTPGTWVFTSERGLERLKDTGYVEKYAFDYKAISRPNMNFYSDKRRAGTLKKLYLIKY